MKKKVFGILSIVLTVVLMAGCNNGNVSATSSVDDTQPVIIEEPSVEPETPEPPEVVSEVEPDPEPAPAPAETNGDPKLAALEVTEEFAMENGLICLYRKGKLYSMGPYVPAQTTYDYIIGWQLDDDKSALFSRVFMSGDNNYADVLLYGDVPEIVLGEGDEIRDYGGTTYWFGTYEFKGYAPNIIKDHYGNVSILKYANDVKPIELRANDAKSLEIIDESDGSSVDFDNYPSCFKEYGIYTISWYEGTKYQEHRMQAKSKIYYSIDCNALDGPEYIMTKEGYRILDFSAYAPGIYAAEQIMPFTIE